MDNSNILSSEEMNALLKKDEKKQSREKSDRKLEVALEFPLDVSVRIGETIKTIDELKDLSTGLVIDLNRMINEPVDLMVNGKLIAQGEVLTMGEYFGVRITSIIKPVDRIEKLR